MTRIRKALAAVGASNLVGILGFVLLLATVTEAFGREVGQASLAALLLLVAYVLHRGGA